MKFRVVWLVALANFPLPCSTFSPLSSEFLLGKRIDASKLTKEAFRELYEGEVPIVLTNVFPRLDSDAWSEQMVNLLGEETIEYDSRNLNGEIESYESTLSEFLEALGENSDHEDSMYLMNEDILPEGSELCEALRIPESLFGSDIFQHFPSPIRPKSALIIGGSGSRSFLHADPFEWVGWNYLMEGTKVWTFLPPEVSMETLQARRNAPEAWGAYNLSAGWVSEEVDLYRYIGVGSVDTPDSGGKKKKKSAVPATPTPLNTMLISAYEKMRDKTNPPPAPLCFHPGRTLDLTAEHISRCVQIVQREGEMVIIPPQWWHQVYHCTPSIAVAGQYVNENGKGRVFSHMLNWCSESGAHSKQAGSSTTARTETVDDILSDPITTDEEIPTVDAILRSLPLLSAKDQVMRIIEQGLVLRLGKKAAKNSLEQLLRDAKAAERERETAE